MRILHMTIIHYCVNALILRSFLSIYIYFFSFYVYGKI